MYFINGPLSFVNRTRVHFEETVGDRRVVHAVGHPRHRPGGRRPGVFRPVRPAGVLGRGGGRARVAHRYTGGQHDGRGDAGKVGEQQPGDRATGGQETVPDGGRQFAPRTMKNLAATALFPSPHAPLHPQIIATRQYHVVITVLCCRDYFSCRNIRTKLVYCT